MSNRLPLLARVECRSEGQAEERPVAVWIGGQRIEVVEIRDDAVVGSRTAGGMAVRRLVVTLADGQSLRLERSLPEGRWRVFRHRPETSGSAG